MKKILLLDSQIGNLLVFLDRVEYKGLKEVQAINEIITALNNAMDNTSQPITAEKEDIK